VENNGSDDYLGWILNATVTITGEILSGPATNASLVVNAANLTGGGAAPGELVSIFGLGLGPEDAEEAPEGNLPTTLGGTEVLFNEQSAPIRFASKYRVDVQAPYALGVPGDARMVVSRSGRSSQADAVNADGSQNKNRVAPRGTEIKVYASGLGITLPLIQSGAVPVLWPAPSPCNTVSATIAGYPVEVISANLSETRPGVYEVKFLIPEFVPLRAASLSRSQRPAQPARTTSSSG
jgi:hypothetical protein